MRLAFIEFNLRSLLLISLYRPLSNLIHKIFYAGVTAFKLSWCHFLQEAIKAYIYVFHTFYDTI